LELHGRLVTLRRATFDDAAELARIRETPEVFARWRGADMLAEVIASIDADGLELLTVEAPNGQIIGAIQWYEEVDPDYRHAGIDIYLDPAVHRRGYGTDAVRTLARHLLKTLGHHRLVIDPVADNAAAIRAYEKVGFRRVGVMRRYERDASGLWRDGLLMELIAEDLIED